ncbi:hypothetical protein [Persicitalea jodogahamensis]|uniref:hypothetical protein n=1 Tax=Persicitalea jodogahamensis TaxID=402147 RepID=UPI001677EFC7|nr:hypothetical protein [Persicitalea jodogahamensis]
MKRLTLYLFLLVCIGCSNKDFENPPLQIKLNEPFGLRNTPRYSIPVNQPDTAVFAVSDGSSFRFVLTDVVDLRCTACLTPQNSYYVELRVNNQPLYLGEIVNNEIQSPIFPADLLKNSVLLKGFRLTLLDIELLHTNDKINANAKYKQATFILTRL